MLVILVPSDSSRFDTNAGHPPITKEVLLCLILGYTAERSPYQCGLWPSQHWVPWRKQHTCWSRPVRAWHLLSRSLQLWVFAASRPLAPQTLSS